MEGTIIVIEGTDCSFKETNADALYKRLKDEGKYVVKFSFPNYGSKSSELVKMYLNGELGSDPKVLNPYAVSQFYAVDRFVTYNNQIKQHYENGAIIVLDRYVTSNMIHQACKFNDKYEKIKYISWLEDLEYSKNSLPAPKQVIFLNMPPEFAKQFNESRHNKIDNSDTKDIHENSDDFMRASYENAMYIADLYSWTIIDCVENNVTRSKQEMADLVYESVMKVI